MAPPYHTRDVDMEPWLLSGVMLASHRAISKPPYYRGDQFNHSVTTSGTVLLGLYNPQLDGQVEHCATTQGMGCKWEIMLCGHRTARCGPLCTIQRGHGCTGCTVGIVCRTSCERIDTFAFEKSLRKWTVLSDYNNCVLSFT